MENIQKVSEIFRYASLFIETEVFKNFVNPILEETAAYAHIGP